MDGIYEIDRAVKNALYGQIPHRFKCRTQINDLVIFSIHHPKYFLHVFCNLPETLLGISQLHFRIFPFGDISGDTHHAQFTLIVHR